MGLKQDIAKDENGFSNTVMWRKLFIIWILDKSSLDLQPSSFSGTKLYYDNESPFQVNPRKCDAKNSSRSHLESNESAS